MAKKLTGDGGLGNEGKEKQCAEFYDASEIEHKETDEYSSGGTKQFEKENIVQVDIANNEECEGEMSNEAESEMKKGNIRHRQGLPICVICKMKCSNKENLMQHIKKCHKRSRDKSCPHCYLDFKSLKSLNNHIDKMHYDVKKNVKRNMCVLCAEAFPSDRLYKKHILEVHMQKTKEVQFKEKCDNDEKKQSTSVRRSSHKNTNDSNEDNKTSSHDSKVKKEFSTQEFKEQTEKETTCQHAAKHTSKGKKRSQHKEVENKVHEKEHVLQIISDDIQCKPLSNSEEKEVKVDVAMVQSHLPQRNMSSISANNVQCLLQHHMY